MASSGCGPAQRARFEKRSGLVNNPVVGLSLGAEVPDVFLQAVFADCFEIPAAAVAIAAKRRLRLKVTSADSHAHSCWTTSRPVCLLRPQCFINTRRGASRAGARVAAAGTAAVPSCGPVRTHGWTARTDGATSEQTIWSSKPLRHEDGRGSSSDSGEVQRV